MPESTGTTVVRQKLDFGLYRSFRAAALLERRPIAQLLEDAIRLYLAAHPVQHERSATP